MPRQLLPGERLVLPPLHRHWVVLVRSLAAPVLGVLLALAVVNGPAHGLVPAELRLLVTLLLLSGLGLWTIGVWVRWTEDALTVTDQRVILEEGLLRRSSRVIPIDRVQDVFTSQTLLARIMGYGSIGIDAAGTGVTERFDHVRSPEKVQDSVSMLIGRARAG